MQTYNKYILSGKQFNVILNNFYGNDERYSLILLTNEMETVNGFKFQDGLNIWDKVFNPTSNFRLGGLCFIFKKDFLKWIKHNNELMVFYRQVTIPDDATVYIGIDEFKTNKIFLNIRKNVLTLNFALIKCYPELLKYIKQTEKTCLDAVRQNGLALQYINIDNQTIQICLEAIAQNSHALKHVKNNINEVCTELIKEQITICLEKLDEHQFASEYVKNECKENFEHIKRKLENHPKNCLKQKRLKQSED